jgi:predicted nucleic acid-binding protein
MPTLIDATVVSNFAAVERLDLLRRALSTAEMAAAVYSEILQGIEDGYEFLRAVDAHVSPGQPHGWLRLTDLEGEDERERYARLLTVVQPGEAASLAMSAHRGWTFATDDRAARLIATQEGVAVTGTLGILLQLVDRGFVSLDEANRLLGLMIARARYRSPATDLRELLEPGVDLTQEPLEEVESAPPIEATGEPDEDEDEEPEIDYFGDGDDED